MSVATQPAPWGVTRVTAFDPSAPVDVPHVELDPVSQTGRYFDPAGRPIEAGRHGSGKVTSRPTKTAASDGQKRTRDDDSTLDYSSD
ncbi:putative ATP-grasp-modified RiPP [Nonomuraea sp. NPDC048916]|uniref:putative ATP-grasp-modified RiPP n=1 Tax=Nonomuraea sp. NPDC048916 TaxID=3154232 RepID=UPI003404E71A